MKPTRKSKLARDNVIDVAAARNRRIGDLHHVATLLGSIDLVEWTLADLRAQLVAARRRLHARP